MLEIFLPKLLTFVTLSSSYDR